MESWGVFFFGEDGRAGGPGLGACTSAGMQGGAHGQSYRDKLTATAITVNRPAKYFQVPANQAERGPLELLDRSFQMADEYVGRIPNMAHPSLGGNGSKWQDHCILARCVTRVDEVDHPAMQAHYAQLMGKQRLPAAHNRKGHHGTRTGAARACAKTDDDEPGNGRVVYGAFPRNTVALGRCR